MIPYEGNSSCLKKFRTSTENLASFLKGIVNGNSHNNSTYCALDEPGRTNPENRRLANGRIVYYLVCQKNPIKASH